MAPGVRRRRGDSPRASRGDDGDQGLAGRYCCATARGSEPGARVETRIRATARRRRGSLGAAHVVGPVPCQSGDGLLRGKKRQNPSDAKRVRGIEFIVSPAYARVNDAAAGTIVTSRGVLRVLRGSRRDWRPTADGMRARVQDWQPTPSQDFQSQRAAGNSGFADRASLEDDRSLAQLVGGQVAGAPCPPATRPTSRPLWKTPTGPSDARGDD